MCKCAGRHVTAASQKLAAIAESSTGNRDRALHVRDTDPGGWVGPQESRKVRERITATEKVHGGPEAAANRQPSRGTPQGLGGGLESTSSTGTCTIHTGYPVGQRPDAQHAAGLPRAGLALTSPEEAAAN